MKKPAVPSVSNTGKIKSHLPPNLTAKDRAEKYATGMFHVDDGLMFCSSCNMVIDHLIFVIIKVLSQFTHKCFFCSFMNKLSIEKHKSGFLSQNPSKKA